MSYSVKTKNRFTAFMMMLFLTVPFMLSVVMTPVSYAHAVVFDDLFRVFGENLQSWDTITSLAKYEQAGDITSDSDKTITITVHENGKAVAKQVRVGTTQLNMAKQVKDEFTDALWQSFCATAGADPTKNGTYQANADNSRDDSANKVTVDAKSNKVARKSGVSQSEYAAIKQALGDSTAESSVSTSINQLYGEGGLDGSSSEVTEGVTSWFTKFGNLVLSIGFPVANILFVVQTTCDILFLSNSFFRGFMLASDAGKATQKAQSFLTFCISASAIKAANCKRDPATKSIMLGGDLGDSDGDYMEVNWFKYIVGRLGLFVGLLTYWVLITTGLTASLVDMMVTLVTNTINALRNL